MIKIENLCKRYGDTEVLKDFNLTVPKGSVYGLMGLNGAGKTTIIKHLAGFIKPDSGSVTIDEQQIEDNEDLKSRVLIIPDEVFFFNSYSLSDMRGYYKKIYKGWNEDRFQTIVNDFSLNTKKNMGKFSKGMRKQAAFCLALSTMPDYLILDEPIDGLNPIVRRKLWHYIMGDVAERQMTVLISSHNAREMEDVCDYVGIIAKGKMIFEGDLLEIMPTSIEEIFIEKLGGENYEV